MRFLCLHGMGTNGKIFGMQTAAIRYGLGSQHTYEFIDGPLPAPMAPGIEAIAEPDEQCFQYTQNGSLDSGIKALHDLERLVDEEGPFDGVMAFSQGAGLVASFIVHKMQCNPNEERIRPVFRCAIFFCGSVPEDPAASVNGNQRALSFEADGELIGIPTAHIWGANDTLYPTFGPVLSKLCRSDLKDKFIHDGGHEIPGPRNQQAVMKATQVINRAIERAKAL
ncbi:serine hydrolase FSH [Camillea tinctor]|nr:serine hydrolase FSH [Camillea tinctor]